VFLYNLLSFSSYDCSSSLILPTVCWVSLSLMRYDLFWQFPLPATISTENLSIELLVYVYYEIKMWLNIHAMNLKVSFFLDGCYEQSMMCLLNQSIILLRDTDAHFYCIHVRKQRIFVLQVQCSLH
jgi:hypothetical protein